MVRRAYGGKTTVESCLSIDVLRWNRLGYLRSPRWFSWAWTRDGERVASIDVEAGHHSVTLKYRSALMARTGATWSSASPSRGRLVGSVARGHGLCVPFSQTACTAVDGSPSSTVLVACSRAATVIGLHTRASRNWPVTEGFGRRRKSEFDWVAARACWIFRTSRKVCTGGHMTACAAFMMLLKSAQSSAHNHGTLMLLKSAQSSAQPIPAPLR